MQKVVLTLEEQIDRARDGRSQMWIVNKLREMGHPMSEAQFTRKKKDSYIGGSDKFSTEELAALSTILDTDFTLPE